jgi:hypothetical protein
MDYIKLFPIGILPGRMVQHHIVHHHLRVREEDENVVVACYDKIKLLLSKMLGAGPGGKDWSFLDIFYLGWWYPRSDLPSTTPVPYTGS